METVVNFILWLLVLCGLGAISYVVTYFVAINNVNRNRDLYD